MAVLTLAKPVDEVLSFLRTQGIDGGYNIGEHYPELGHALLICATEMRTDEEIAHYAKALAECFTTDKE